MSLQVADAGGQRLKAQAGSWTQHPLLATPTEVTCMCARVAPKTGLRASPYTCVLGSHSSYSHALHGAMWHARAGGYVQGEADVGPDAHPCEGTFTRGPSVRTP